MPLDIVTIEHSPHSAVLIVPAATVKFPLSHDDQELITQMKEKLTQLRGVGLAAPQVGVAKQIIVFNIDQDAKALRKDSRETVGLTVLINPSYKPTQDAKIVHDWEACFSVLDITGKVPRYDKITYTAQSLDGNLLEGLAEGFTARVLQHEIDHIQGILITKRLTADCLKGHPKDMLALRFKELNHEQKALIKKMLLEREKNTDPNDLDQMQYIKAMKEALNHHEQ